MTSHRRRRLTPEQQAELREWLRKETLAAKETALLWTLQEVAKKLAEWRNIEPDSADLPVYVKPGDECDDWEADERWAEDDYPHGGQQ
jgi:transposase